MRRRLLGYAAVAAWSYAVVGAGCAATPDEAPVRAIQSSGPVSFLCLDDPSLSLSEMALPLADCGTIRSSDQDDFASPHMYALATQPNTGEVAVIDLSTRSDAIVDADPSVPGAGFLPVGSSPTAIVATPRSTATFVTAAQPNFEGIYALPSDMVRGGAPRLTSWPACALPSAPGEMVLMHDPADADGAVRPSCDLAYGDEETGPGCEGETHCHGDLSADAVAFAGPGRLKLAITLPDEGGVAVLDAQDILDREAGTREPCVIERWLPLEVALPPPPPPAPPPSGACVPIEEAGATPSAAAFSPLPGDVAMGGSRLFVSDRAAPVIHRIEMLDPCDPRELPPLVTRSAADPTRVVTTRTVSVSPLTLDLKRFLYAVDEIDGTVMVYDVSDGGGSTYPLERQDPSLNPFEPRDRIFFGSPPRKIVIVQHQSDEPEARHGSDRSSALRPPPQRERRGDRVPNRR